MFQRTLVRLAAGMALAASLVAHGTAQSGYANPDLLIAPEELAQAITDAKYGVPPLIHDGEILLIDVREAADFDAGHIPGALQISPDAVADPDSPVAGALRPLEELAAMLEALGVTPAKRLIFYDDRGAFHAARMFWLAEYLGHQNVSVLDGGLTAWTKAGGPLATGQAEAAEPGAFTAALMPRRHATADWILEHRDDASVIDVRPAKMYAEGHIPWAQNIPWAGNLGDTGRMLPADALQARFAEFGVTPDSNVAIHCQVGLAAAHSYVALRLLGYPQVRVYHRSWSEWGAFDDLPRDGGA
ncbi:sulfurtransferase [Pseudoruegeria sp. HB172150]|uniref:sulfurtransferase n=1 Tax=Pseudoruegeria sp. HB172150 TaxID=2721164 RepID=UPI001554DE06|nr:sulfurtransferase [Pseudoruegeria sp. HB172150]